MPVPVIKNISKERVERTNSVMMGMNLNMYMYVCMGDQRSAALQVSCNYSILVLALQCTGFPDLMYLISTGGSNAVAMYSNSR